MIEKGVFERFLLHTQQVRCRPHAYRRDAHRPTQVDILDDLRLGGRFIRGFGWETGSLFGWTAARWMGGCSSQEVQGLDPPALSAKAGDVGCAPFVGQTIATLEVDGGTAYEIKTFEPDDFREFLVDAGASSVTKKGSIKAALKKLPSEEDGSEGLDLVPAAAPAPRVENENEGPTRRLSVPQEVVTQLIEWSPADLATLFERQGEDPAYSKMAKCVRDTGIDGKRLARFDGATATILALLDEIDEIPKILGTIKMEKMQGLLRELRGNPDAERTHWRSIGKEAARGIPHINKPSSVDTHAAKLVVLGEQLALGTLVTPRKRLCVALVVCLAAYADQPPLRNPVHDGLDMREFLQKQGFTVILVRDGNKLTIEQQITEFIKMLAPGVVALVFYAGHAVEIEGAGYLLPIDFKTEGDVAQAKHDAISLPLLVEKMSRTDTLIRIIIVDACRTPLPGQRGGGAELRLPPPPVGGVFLFATSSGTPASDGQAGSRNGLFTKHLLDALQQPLTLGQAFMSVVRGVSAASGEKQRPQTVHNLTNEFCFRTDIEAVGMHAADDEALCGADDEAPRAEATATLAKSSDADDDQQHSGDRGSAKMAPSMLLLVVVIPDAVVAGHARCATLYEENMTAIGTQLFACEWLADRRGKTVLSGELEGDPRDLAAENIVIAARGTGWTPSTMPEVRG